jgi:hypothetical protein
MDFLRDPLTTSLVGNVRGKHVCFAADLFTPRPPFDEILGWQQRAAELQEQFKKLMDRTACPIEWLAFFIDGEGALMLATTKARMQVNNMRSALDKVLGPLPKEQQQAVVDSLRAMDEEDKARTDAWQSLDVLRPKARAPPAATPAVPQTLEEFMEENDYSDDDGSDDEPPAQTLALRPAGGTLAVCGPVANLVWAARAQAYATVVLCCTGPAPELTYIRCYKESRRHLLLTRHLKDEGAEDLAGVVRFAALLAKEGALPGHGRQRTSEFMRRCVSALQVVNPRAETDPAKLPREEQAAVRRALGDEKEPYQGCLSEQCLGKETVWVTEDLGDDLKLSRCTRCRMPKAMGRTLCTPMSLIAERMKRERGMMALATERRVRARCA